MSTDFDEKWGPDFLKLIPATAGVYIFRDEKGQAIYVGKAKHLRRRLSAYRLAGAKKSQRKMRLIVRKASSIEFQSCASETEALLLENQLIQAYSPIYNIAGAYAFLYPYLALKVLSKNEIVIAYTTSPDSMKGLAFDLYGAFRSRERVGQAYEAISKLLDYVGHNDSAQRSTFGRVPYTRIDCFRQVDSRWLEPISKFLRGESTLLLEQLFALLLEKTSARRNAGEVQGYLKCLREFYLLEASALRRVLNHHCRAESMIPQEERDPLFLSAPQKNMNA